MLSIFDLACSDAITTKDNTWFKNLIDINNGKYDKEDNKIKNLDEVCILIKAHNAIYFRNTMNNNIEKADSSIATSIMIDPVYRFSLQRGIEKGTLEFFRKANNY